MSARDDVSDRDFQMWATLSERDIEREVFGRDDNPLGSWNDARKNCHGISLAIVKSRLFDVARVARGMMPGISGQHSVVVVGDDVYSPTALTVDCSRWSYISHAPKVFLSDRESCHFRPHGLGSIFDVGRPSSRGGEIIPLSDEARRGMEAVAWSWLQHFCPHLDAQGWMALANAPVGDWPAADVVLAMYRTDALRPFVPLDRLGMLTDVNPGGLYLREDRAADLVAAPWRGHDGSLGRHVVGS